MVILDWLYEYWLPIRGYEGLYEVSNWGRIKSTYKGKIIKPSKNKNECSNAEKPVIQYTKNMVFVKEFESQREASKITQIPQSNISNCVSGKRKTAGGYIWKYGQ